jgi:predicted nucleic acid-binding protein
VKKFVLDVNSWVSVFYRDKHPTLVKLAEEEQIDIFTSLENIAEFADVMPCYRIIRIII